MARVLITGCSSGIGRATAVELTSRGHQVVATARDPRSLDDLDVSERHALDVTNDDSVAALRETVGPVEVLVNNAGVAGGGPVETVPIAIAIRGFDTNFFGVLRMTQAFLPDMRERRAGRIVNISSIAARLAQPLGGSVYGASKRAMEFMTEALRLEVGHLGVHVSIVEPPYVVSRLGENRLRTDNDVPDYADLAARMANRPARLAVPMPTEDAAVGIADIVEAEEPRLLYVLGEEAEGRIERRSSMSDGDYEAMIHSELGLVDDQSTAGRGPG